MQFSFNAPSGACPVCHGLGQKMVLDEHLVVPDAEKSLEQGAVLPWRRGGKRMVVYYKSHALRAVAGYYNVNMETPYKAICRMISNRRLCGAPGRLGNRVHFWRAGKQSKNHAAIRRRDSQSRSGFLSRERKRVHQKPPQGIHVTAILRRLRAASGSSLRFLP